MQTQWGVVHAQTNRFAIFRIVECQKNPSGRVKAIVLQVVAYAGETPDSNTSLVSSLDIALRTSRFQHRILAGNVERTWTIWPSSDPVKAAAEIIEQIHHQLLPALLAHRAMAAGSIGD